MGPGRALAPLMAPGPRLVARLTPRFLPPVDSSGGRPPVELIGGCAPPLRRWPRGHSLFGPRALSVSVGARIFRPDKMGPGRALAPPTAPGPRLVASLRSAFCVAGGNARRSGPWPVRRAPIGPCKVRCFLAVWSPSHPSQARATRIRSGSSSANLIKCRPKGLACSSGDRIAGREARVGS